MSPSSSKRSKPQVEPNLKADLDNFLEVENLRTHFPVETGFVFKRRVGEIKAVDGVSFTLKKGEVLGLVGESGCGKSTLGRTILQLIPATEGNVILEGRNLNRLKSRELRRARADFQMIFQDPYASLKSTHDGFRRARGSNPKS